MTASHTDLIESLESRRLLSVSVGLDRQGVLHVTGSSHDDAISLDLWTAAKRKPHGHDAKPPAFARTLVVSSGDGRTRSFNADLITSIVINARAGDDVITLGPGVGHASIDGGPGHDTVIGANDTDTLTNVESPPPVVGPVITVLRGGLPLADGTAVSFGSRTRGSAPPLRSFVVRNDGDRPLSLGALALPAGYLVVDPLVRSLAPGASDQFIVKLRTTSEGFAAGVITFASSDPRHRVFHISVTGTITRPPGPMALVNASAPNTLVVTGTPLADHISFNSDSASLRVLSNATVIGTFSGINKIVVNALAGDDTVSLAQTSIPAIVDGGAGNDLLTGGGSNDILRGSDGNDTLIGGGGRDQLYGGAGDDVLNAIDGIPDPLLDGGPGTNVIHADPTDHKA